MSITLSQHPQVESAQAAFGRSRQEQKEEFSAYFPELNVTATGGRIYGDNSTSRGLSVTRGTGYSYLWEGSVSARQKIFDGMETRNRVGAARSQVKAAELALIDVRENLAYQAIAVASAGGPGRFGTVAIRMTGDLVAVKDWANRGVCGGLAGLFGLAGGFTAAWLAAAQIGLLAVAAGPLLGLVLFAVLYPLLVRMIRYRRRSKGRLSARIGDLLLNAQSSAAYGAERRAVKPVVKAGDEVLRDTCRETALSTILRLPALMTLPLGMAIGVMLEVYGHSPADGTAGWAALLFALSLTALALGLLGEAVIQFAERQIGMARLRELMTQARIEKPAAPKGYQRLPPGPALELHYDGRRLIRAGEFVNWRHSSIEPLLGDILRGAPQVSIGDHCADEIYAIDWPRRVAYAGLRRPLPRGRIEQLLAARKNTTPIIMAKALELAGLPVKMLESREILDPRSPSLSPWVQARLRLARALAHRPRLLIIDDPALLMDRALIGRIKSYCAESSVSLALVVEDGLQACYDALLLEPHRLPKDNGAVNDASYA
ncbi:MAG: TolC family protein [Gammaproteobacteria bacterium]|nr:TolC family protein [Gammaproteobacteria bacterium]